MDVVVSLTTPGCPIRSHFQKAVIDSVSALEGVTHGARRLRRALRRTRSRASSRSSAAGALPEGSLAQVKNVICVGSGKGGVGKSTVTANLAAALLAEGKQAAALDADVWGYSIPRMLGVHGRPKVSAERKIIPLEAHGGVKAISIEYFLDARDQAITWRGPMLHKAIRQFLEDVDWGELDYLLIDLPPGTGDVSMTLAQLLPQAKFVVVTTPQPAAQKVAKRAAETARRFDLEIAGVIENMSGFTTPAASASRSSARAAASCWPTSSTCRCSARSRSRRSCASAPTRAGRWCSRIRTRRPSQAHLPRGARPDRRDAAGAARAPGAVGPARPDVTGTALPMAQ